MNIKKHVAPTRQAMASWQDQMREAFFEGVTSDDMRAIVLKLVEQAKKGDHAAMKLLFAYGIGSPVVSVKNAVIVSQSDHGVRAPLPCGPTESTPQSEGKIEAMRRRASNGQSVFHAGDRKACGE